MTEPPPLTIKGKRIRGCYSVALPDVFAQFHDRTLERFEVEQSLVPFSDLLPGIGASLIDELFPSAVFAERRSYARYPCTMGNAPPDKARLNLLYQDTRIKLAFEEHASLNSGDVDTTRVSALLKSYAILLHAAAPDGTAAWRHCTDNDLDALTFLILNIYDPARRDRLLSDGRLANRRSVEALEALVADEAPTPARFIPRQVHAGLVWWTEAGEPRVPDNALTIDDVSCFLSEVSHRPCTLVVLFDDNGELVWDLYFVQQLLTLNAQLRVVGVVSTEVVSNNANTGTLKECLSRPIFRDLVRNKRFTVFEERNIRSAIDPTFCSRALLSVIEGADLVFIKGVAFFETIQGLHTTTYYAFVVHSRDSQRCTGLGDGDGVFVRVPATHVAFTYGYRSLLQNYPALRAQFEG